MNILHTEFFPSHYDKRLLFRVRVTIAMLQALRTAQYGAALPGVHSKKRRTGRTT